MHNFNSAVIFDIARKKLPAGRLQNIFSRSKRLLDYWAAREGHEERRNPLDRIRMLLEDLDLHGYGDYARAALDYIGEPLGVHISEEKQSKSDKGSVALEVIDATICLGDLAGLISEAMADGNISDEEMVRLKSAARQLTDEVEQIMDVVNSKGIERRK